MEANGSAAAVAAMISAGASETKRKHHDEVEPFKDVKRVSCLRIRQTLGVLFQIYRILIAFFTRGASDRDRERTRICVLLFMT